MSTKKPAWRKLSWDRTGQRWMKRYKTKLSRFPLQEAKRPESQASHDRCWKQWLEQKAQIDRAQANYDAGVVEGDAEFKRGVLTSVIRIARGRDDTASIQHVVFFHTRSTSACRASRRTPCTGCGLAEPSTRRPGCL